jgi:hypothetical protein
MRRKSALRSGDILNIRNYRAFLAASGLATRSR